MKINEIITEGMKGEYGEHHATAQNSSWRFRDVGGYDRIYHLNRIMMAAAAADGVNRGPIQDFEQESWYEKYNTAFPYSQGDDNQIASALATIDSEHHNASTFEQSHEPRFVYNKSPVLSKPPIKLLKKGEKPDRMPELELDKEPHKTFQKQDRKSLGTEIGKGIETGKKSNGKASTGKTKKEEKKRGFKTGPNFKAK
jgi:hypothetical protein